MASVPMIQKDSIGDQLEGIGRIGAIRRRTTAPSVSSRVPRGVLRPAVQVGVHRLVPRRVLNTRPELADAVIQWLVDNGVPKSNIIIWDRLAVGDSNHPQRRMR
jgi:hypothetical protein